MTSFCRETEWNEGTQEGSEKFKWYITLVITSEAGDSPVRSDANSR